MADERTVIIALCYRCGTERVSVQAVILGRVWESHLRFMTIVTRRTGDVTVMAPAV